MSLKQKHPCTLAFDPVIIKREGGILPYLYDNDAYINILLESICQTSPTPQPNNETKYAKIRYTWKTQYDTLGLLRDVDLADYFKEQDRVKIPHDGSPRVLVFTHNNHRFDLWKKGYHNYTIKSIDGKSVLNSFTEQEILNIYKGTPFLHWVCEIDKEVAPQWTFKCHPIIKRP